MKARWVSFGEIEIDGECFRHDVVIDQGVVRKRRKGPSKALRANFGHTPLSAGEEIPWQGSILYVGTGARGALPILPDVFAQARQRGVHVVVDKTPAICRRLENSDEMDVNAILHVTC